MKLTKLLLVIILTTSAQISAREYLKEVYVENRSNRVSISGLLYGATFRTYDETIVHVSLGPNSKEIERAKRSGEMPSGEFSVLDVLYTVPTSKDRDKVVALDYRSSLATEIIECIEEYKQSSQEKDSQVISVLDKISLKIHSKRNEKRTQRKR